MPKGLTKEILHSYDPSIIFHSHSSNLPLLSNWIDELASLTESSLLLPTTTFPSTQNLIQALQRYNVVFNELVKQTAIFSDAISRMLAKVWNGVFSLMDYMVKTYHRYVRHTSDIQYQAQNLLNERQKGDAAAKIAHEELELERVHLRARIRVLEAELDAVKLTKFAIQRENEKMRNIIDVYITSSDMNYPIFDLLNEGEDHVRKIEEETHSGNMRKKDSNDAGRMQLRNLNRLDIEMNDILTGVLKEENRQKLLMKDLIRLIDRNKSRFVSDSESSDVAKNDPLHSGTSTESIGIQADMKDNFNVVLETDVPTSLPVGVAPLAPHLIVLRGSELPYQVRKLMRSFPHILRIPPAVWACQTIMSIYLDKMDVEEEVKADKDCLAVYTHKYFQRVMGLPSAADVQVIQLFKTCEVHSLKHPRIFLFASQVGLTDKNELPRMDVRDTEFILQILRLLRQQVDVVESKGNNHKKLSSKLNLFGMRPDIPRIAAISAASLLFKKWLPDGGEEVVQRVKAMPHSDRGSRFVDVDQVVQVLIDPWRNIVRTCWEEHAKYLFREYCSVHRVIAEAVK